MEEHDNNSALAIRGGDTESKLYGETTPATFSYVHVVLVSDRIFEQWKVMDGERILMSPR